MLNDSLKLFPHMPKDTIIWLKCDTVSTQTKILDMADSEDEAQEAKKGKVDRTSRSTYESVDWPICIFCQKKKYKGVKELISVASFDSCQAIVDAAIARDDQRLLLNIKGVDFIAKEAKYHGKFRSKYVSKTNPKCLRYKEDNEEEEECVYSAAFAVLVDEITPGLSEGKIYDMSHLLDRYKQVLKVKGTSCSNYRSEKLKRRMRGHFLDQIVIEKQNDPSKPELIYSSHLSVADIVKTSVSQQSSEDFEVDEDTRQDMEQDKATILYQAAQIIRNDIKQCNGIIKPLCVDDVSIEKGRCLIPESLYSFLSEVISRQDKKATTVSDGSTLSAEKGRRVVMLGQDIIHAASNSQVKTSKHIGLAVTVHHLIGSKEVVTLLNRIGNCSSYDDVEIVSTAWAREMEARSQQTRVVIPSNITAGPFFPIRCRQ